MPTEPRCAVVVDAQEDVAIFNHHIRQITDAVDDNLQNGNGVTVDCSESAVVKDCHVFLMSSKTNYNTTSDPRWTQVVQPSRIQCFYEAKRKFDNEGTVDVVVMCLMSHEGYWKAVCETLLTPVHSWRIQTVYNDSSMPLDPGTVVNDVKAMLSKLPGIGEMAVLTTPLVPSNIFNHGYSTRNGGITTIPTLSSLNLLYTPKKRDSRLTVAENVRRLASAADFDPENFYLTKTEHGNAVWIIGEDQPERYDSMVTDKPGLTLAAAGADCTPLLFFDPVNRICGAAHAGYRGTLLKVAVETVEAMTRRYGSKAKDILVTMGPTVCPECFSFEVDDPAVEAFKAIDASVVGHRQRGGKTRVTTDIVTSNRLHLERAGVLSEHIDVTHAICTACDPARFYSYERDGFPFGNQIGFASIIP